MLQLRHWYFCMYIILLCHLYNLPDKFLRWELTCFDLLVIVQEIGMRAKAPDYVKHLFMESKRGWKSRWSETLALWVFCIFDPKCRANVAEGKKLGGRTSLKRKMDIYDLIQREAIRAKLTRECFPSLYWRDIIWLY